MAVDLVKGLTGDPTGVVTLSKQSQKLLPNLLKLISDTDNIQQSAVTPLLTYARHAWQHQAFPPRLKECKKSCLLLTGH